MGMDAAVMGMLDRIGRLEQRLERLSGAEIPLGTVRQRGIVASFSGTRTVASYADVDSTNGKVTLSTTGGDLLAIFTGYASNTSAGIAQSVAVRLDAGADVAGISAYSYAGLATYPVPFCVAYLFTGVSGTKVLPVSHSVYARHSNNSATGTMTTTGYLIVVEIGPA